MCTKGVSKQLKKNDNGIILINNIFLRTFREAISDGKKMNAAFISNI